MILFRVDASKKIGLGHLMRCLALADNLKDDHKLIFIVREPDIDIISLIKKRGCSYRYIPESSRIEEEIEMLNEWIKIDDPLALIFDGYHLNNSYQSKIKCDGIFVHLGILSESYSLADIVVNPNPWATKDLYIGKVKDTARLLVGSDYVLIGSHIQQIKKCEVKQKIDNILLTFGGSSDGKVEYKVYDSLKDLHYNFNMVAGQINKLKESINLTIHAKILELDLLMQRADLVICAAGSTCWELCYLGLPFISYITTDNQIVNADFLSKKQISIVMGSVMDLNGPKLKSTVFKLEKKRRKRETMSINGKNLIDGLGAKRVANAIIDYHK